MRKRTPRRPVPALPRWLRPRLDADQVRDLELVHLVNLDASLTAEETRHLVQYLDKVLLDRMEVSS